MILIDSNVLIDVLTEDPEWFDWSSSALSQASNNSDLAINPIIFAEVSNSFHSLEVLVEALPESLFRREPIPYEAAFLAAKVHQLYRKRGGKRTSTLPDFFIGAHAAVSHFDLITRDVQRFRTYFPTVNLISP